MARVYKRADAIVARRPGVKKAVYAKGAEIGDKAKALLAEHRVTGNAHIEVKQHKVDTIVALNDPAALSIEYGRGEYTRDDGVTVGAMEGLYILHRAAGLK